MRDWITIIIFAAFLGWSWLGAQTEADLTVKWLLPSACALESQPALANTPWRSCTLVAMQARPCYGALR